MDKSRTLGKGWYETVDWEAYSERACLEPSSARTVTVTFPDGKVYKFNVQAQPECWVGDPTRSSPVGTAY